ncbi:MAG: hypothetical protein AAGG80_07165, partial [Pseudomonadota bacterium]
MPITLENYAVDSRNLEEAVKELPLQIKSALVTEANQVENVDQAQYLQLLILLYYASIKEQKYSPQEQWLENAKSHTSKLFITFGDLKAVQKYLEDFISANETRVNGKSNQPIHDACLFDFPSDKVKKLVFWQQVFTKSKPNHPENKVMRLL